MAVTTEESSKPFTKLSCQAATKGTTCGRKKKNVDLTSSGKKKKKSHKEAQK